MLDIINLKLLFDVLFYFQLYNLLSEYIRVSISAVFELFLMVKQVGLVFELFEIVFSFSAL